MFVSWVSFVVKKVFNTILFKVFHMAHSLICIVNCELLYIDLNLESEVVLNIFELTSFTFSTYKQMLQSHFRPNHWFMHSLNLLRYVSFICYKSEIFWPRGLKLALFGNVTDFNPLSTPQNRQTHSNNSSAVAVEWFECGWPFCGVDAYMVNFNIWRPMCQGPCLLKKLVHIDRI